MKQTAVEWLVSYMDENFHLTDESLSKLEQAKEMEKEQIVDAHLFGLLHPLEMEATKQAEQYYNETYNK